MSTATLPDTRPAEKPTTGDGDVYHTVCCDDTRALCGTDVADAAWGRSPGDQDCVVCEELAAADVPCVLAECSYRDPDP